MPDSFDGYRSFSTFRERSTHYGGLACIHTWKLCYAQVICINLLQTSQCSFVWPIDRCRLEFRSTNGSRQGSNTGPIVCSIDTDGFTRAELTFSDSRLYIHRAIDLLKPWTQATSLTNQNIGNAVERETQQCGHHVRCHPGLSENFYPRVAVLTYSILHRACKTDWRCIRWAEIYRGVRLVMAVCFSPCVQRTLNLSWRSYFLSVKIRTCLIISTALRMLAGCSSLELEIVRAVLRGQVCRMDDTRLNAISNCVSSGENFCQTTSPPIVPIIFVTGNVLCCGWK